MEKKMFWSLSDNADLSNYFLGDLDAVKEYIENEVPNIDKEDLKEHQWLLTPVFMTQDEFDNLPEYQF